uniref:GDSL-like Lipase/Acylhydrolase family protein n=1 Tax=Candidatus Kentrum sp. MB TaxID=2138164 RepID=A0A450XHF2_9GAMM|nr:MAG: GDSL-like Lipase/Acylhydrolase family protein [Candidatus Kentron sp. MB]VFK74074.1 MAG: GDSL-like Lipase/Acylhydrolase family protein [Candidatus Kentron sp. MB]
MSWIKKSLFLTIGWIVILIPALILMEFLCRSLFPQTAWMEARRINVIRDVTYRFGIDHLYPYPEDTITYTRDEYGLRMRCRDPAEVDILTIGGSTTDQRYIDDGETFQIVLEDYLEKKLGKDICVANAGLDGHSTYGHLLAFEHWFPLIPNLKPKHIIFYIGLNDSPFRNGPTIGFDVIDESIVKNYLRANSIIYQSLRDAKYALLNRGTKFAYGGHAPKVDIDFPAIRLSDGVSAIAERHAKSFSTRLVRLLDHTRQLGAKPICVSQPHRSVVDTDQGKRGIAYTFSVNGVDFNGLDADFTLQKTNQVMREVCGEALYMDLYSKEFSADSFYDYVHTTPKGSREIGLYLASEYEQLGLVRDLLE